MAFLSWLLSRGAGLVTPHEAGSGRLFQCIDHLLQDVGTVVCYLLKNGIGKLLQFCIVSFAFFQLILKLKEKGEVDFR